MKSVLIDDLDQASRWRLLASRTERPPPADASSRPREAGSPAASARDDTSRIVVSAVEARAPGPRRGARAPRLAARPPSRAPPRAHHAARARAIGERAVLLRGVARREGRRGPRAGVGDWCDRAGSPCRGGSRAADSPPRNAFGVQVVSEHHDHAVDTRRCGCDPSHRAEASPKPRPGRPPRWRLLRLDEDQAIVGLARIDGHARVLDTERVEEAPEGEEVLVGRVGRSDAGDHPRALCARSAAAQAIAATLDGLVEVRLDERPVAALTSG